MSSLPYLSRRTFRVNDAKEAKDAIIGFRGGINRANGFITWIQPIFRKPLSSPAQSEAYY
jgi:hypothetical protein